MHELKSATASAGLQSFPLSGLTQVRKRSNLCQLPDCTLFTPPARLPSGSSRFARGEGSAFRFS